MRFVSPRRKPTVLACVVMVCFASSTSAAEIGKCRFETTTSAFAGSPVEQAKCLLRKVKIFGHVDVHPAVLPSNLSNLIGNRVAFASEAIKRAIEGTGLDEEKFGGNLDRPLSKGNDNDPAFPTARYFVIHDTSTPNFRTADFPADVDADPGINKLSRYEDASNAKAHIFLNRKGEIYVGHGFSTPWRATKIEIAGIGKPSKGLFLHIENIQPRRSHPGGAVGNDAISPSPGLSDIQYDRLALLYAAASFRSGTWLIPAFHAALDEGFANAHDDPQNFEIEKFDAALGRLLSSL